MKKCPYCAEEIQDEAIVCRYCGRDLASVPAPVQSLSTQTKPDVKKASTQKMILRAIGGLLLLCICAGMGSLINKRGSNRTTPDATKTPRITNPQNPTHTPLPTRTPRPTPTEISGTLDNPHSFGEEVPLVMTVAGEKSTLMLRVREVVRGEPALAIIKRANSFNDDPPPGMEYALIKIGVTLTKGNLKMTSADFVVATNGQLFDEFSSMACCTDELGYAKVDANLIVPGATTDGWIIRTVFIEDAKPLLAVGVGYNNDISDAIFFALSPGID